MCSVKKGNRKGGKIIKSYFVITTNSKEQKKMNWRKFSWEGRGEKRLKSGKEDEYNVKQKESPTLGKVVGRINSRQLHR